MLSSLWGRITGKDKQKQYPDQQAVSLGRVGDNIILFPYGLYADLPAETLLKTLAPGVAISVTVERPSDTEQGEPVFFHPVTGSRIIMRNNGDVEIIADKVKFSGGVEIGGNLTVDGDTALGATVTSNGKDISDTHTHTGSPTAATGPVTPTGTPI